MGNTFRSPTGRPAGQWSQSASSGDDPTRANAAELESAIEALDPTCGRSGDFWANVKVIHERFKTIRPLRSDDRQRLWVQFQERCDNRRLRQERERLDREAVSRTKRDIVLDQIDEARRWAEAASERDHITRAQELLAKAREWMKDGWDAANLFTHATTFNDGRMTKQDGDYCWGRHHEVRETISINRDRVQQSECEALQDRAYDALAAARSGDSREARRLIKVAQQELHVAYVTPPQRESIKKILQDAWDLADQYAQQRHQDWCNQMEEHIDRWSENIRSNNEYISRLESQVEHLRSLESNARTSEHADRVRTWIDEKLDKINLVEDRNRELEERIASVRERLSGR